MFAFQTNELNRHGDSRHKKDFIERQLEQRETRFLPIFEQAIVCQSSPSQENTHTQLSPHWLNYDALSKRFGTISLKHLIYLGEINNTHHFAYRLKSEVAVTELQSHNNNAQNLELSSLRLLLKQLPPEEAYLCNIAIALEHWHNTHQYCGYCGHKTYATDAGFVRACSNAGCAKLHFPRTDAAVICAITYHDKILLGRQESWPEKRYSVIAGFVEPGESLEQAIAREAYEETGLELTNINYYSSQPWPFPQSLMVGFTAEATHDTIKLLDQELEQAHWFSREDVLLAINNQELLLPFKYSISRALITQWLES